MYADTKKEHREHGKLLKGLMKHFSKDEREIDEEEKEEHGERESREHHREMSCSSKMGCKGMKSEKNYPTEYYDKSKVKQEPNKKFYPAYDGERDEYEKVSIKGSPWANWKEPPEVGNNGKASDGSESEASYGRKREEQRVSETLENPKHHKASKADRKKMATVVISARMRKRKNSM